MAPHQIVVTARTTRLKFRSIAVSLAAVCVLGLIVVVSPANPAIGATRALLPRTASLPSCSIVSASMLKTYLGVKVSANHSIMDNPDTGYSQTCTYAGPGPDFMFVALTWINGETTESFNAIPSVLPKSVETRVVTGIGNSALAYERVIFRGIGTYFGLDVLKGDWVLEINWVKGAQGFQPSLKKAKALATVILPRIGASGPSVSVNCTAICAFAVGSGEVMFSWPDTASKYTLATYVNRVLLTNFGEINPSPKTDCLFPTCGAQDVPSHANGQEYEELLNDYPGITLRVGDTVSFEYTTNVKNEDGPWSAMSNTVVVK